jgi:threonine/homoserine/homoserine lactone efflux protein
VAFSLSRRLTFGTSRLAQLIFSVVLAGAAAGMIFVNYTDYPQAFRLLQVIALACIIFTACDYLLAWRKPKSPPASEATSNRLSVLPQDR